MQDLLIILPRVATLLFVFAFGAYFVHGDRDAGRRPGALHELLGMHERSGSVRAARVRGADPAKLGAELWAKLDGGGAR